MKSRIIYKFLLEVQKKEGRDENYFRHFYKKYEIIKQHDFIGDLSCKTNGRNLIKCTYNSAYNNKHKGRNPIYTDIILSENGRFYIQNKQRKITDTTIIIIGIFTLLFSLIGAIK